MTTTATNFFCDNENLIRWILDMNLLYETLLCRIQNERVSQLQLSQRNPHLDKIDSLCHEEQVNIMR